MICLSQKTCGLASLKIPGSGLMGACHLSVIGYLLSLTTLKVRIVLLSFSKIKASGMT